MASFYFPAYDMALLADPDPAKPPAHHANAPINLDLVVTFLPSQELYDFNPEAGMPTRRRAFPAIRFDLPGLRGGKCWFYEDERSRDAELRALTNHLVNKAS